MPAPRILQIQIAVPSPAVARRLSEALLDARLCACAQVVGPLSSRYLWRGKRESAREWLLLIKTRAGLFEPLVTVVHRLHPYEVPEILAVPVTAIDPAYARWLEESTAGRAAHPRRRATRPRGGAAKHQEDAARRQRNRPRRAS
jgi:periplasmic divalent cation tolerance protein